MKNYQLILTTVISFGVGIKILMGEVPSHYFAGELNEIGCAVIALSLGVFSLFAYDWKGIVKWLVK